jgi:hypothetical protein
MPAPCAGMESHSGSKEINGSWTLAWHRLKIGGFTRPESTIIT